VTILPALLLASWTQPLEPPPRFERLPNGLRVCVVTDPSVPLVGVQLWYRVGSVDDPAHQPGLCHVLRLLLEHRERAALRARAAGLHFESRTLRDACSFETVLPADPNYLAFVLDLEAARMRPLTVTRETLAEAIDATVRCSPAVCSARSDGDADGPVIEPRLLSALLPEHPYRHPPGTVAEPVRHASAEQAGEFLARWFVPGNATLLVIGDVQPDEVMEMIRQRFSSLSTVADPTPAAPPRRPERRVPDGGFAFERIERGEDSPDSSALRFAWLTPPAASIENAAFDVLMQRLCNPVDGPLYQRLSAAGFGAVRWRRESWREAGVLVLEVQPAPHPIDGGTGEAAAVRPGWAEAGPIIRRELERAAAERPTEIEFNRARNLAAGAVLENRASFAARARRLGEHELIGGDLLLAEFELPRVQRIPVGAMQAAARTLLKAWAEMEKQEQPAPASQSSGPQDGQEARDAGTEQKHQTTPPVGSEPIRPTPGEILDLLAAHAPALSMVGVAEEEGRRISGGVSVIRTAGAELATVAALGGPRPLCVMELRVRLAAGSMRHSAAELRDYLSYHAIRPGSLEGAAALVGPKDRLAAMLELWGELLFEPNLEEAVLETACRTVFAELRSGPPARCADGIVESVWITGSEQIAPSTILDWQQEMVWIVHRPTEPRFPVLVVADADFALTSESEERIFHEKLSRLLSKGRPGGGPQARPAPAAAAWPGGDSPRVFWVPRGSGNLELRVAWPLDRQARAEPGGPVAGGGLRGAMAAALLGATLDDQPPALDAQRARSWSARVLSGWHHGSDSQLVVLSRRIGAGALTHELARVLDRVRQIHNPHTPPPPRYTQTAMRLAAMALHLRRGFPLETLPVPASAAGVQAHQAEATPSQAAAADPHTYWRDRLALSRPPQPLVVVVGGGSELRAELEKVGQVVQVSGSAP
jgi:zinc protease